MSEPGRNGFLAFLSVLWRGLNVIRVLILNVIFFAIVIFVLSLLARSAPRVQADSTLVLKPRGTLVEQYSIDPTERALASISGNPSRQVQLRDLLAVIDTAAHDDHIRRILLEPQELDAGGFAAMREVARALERFKAAGKQVIVWAPDLGQDQYYLAAHASRVLLDPQGSVLLTGLSNYRTYYKDLLDKLGVNVHLFRVGQYKSAAEPYVLNQASPASRQADSYWLGGLWNAYLGEVAQARGIDVAELHRDIDQLPDQVAGVQGNLAQLALRQHLVDGLATRAELIGQLRKLGAPPGPHGHGFRGIDFDQYLSLVHGARLPSTKPEVAVVVAEGEISGGRQPAGTIGGESTSALLRQARQDDDVKAVVLRVNSPGGEVYAAEQIRREVVLTRQAGKPVIVSMGDVAASGGYWISMNADAILAEPDTITGSIGIFGMFFTVPQTLDKLGIHTDGVKTSPWAGAFDIRRPLDPRVGDVIQSVIDKGYRDFVGRVARARNKSFKTVDQIAQGRVWTGRQALDRGLVDRMGGIEEAVRLAARHARLKTYQVDYLEKPLSPFERTLLNYTHSAMLSWVQATGVHLLPHWLAEVPHLLPGLDLFKTARVGRPNIYAYCFCAPGT